MGDLGNVLRPSDTFNIVVFADGSTRFHERPCPPRLPISRVHCSSSAGGTAVAERGFGGARAVAIDRQAGVSRSIVLVDRWLHRSGIGGVRLRPGSAG